MDNFIAALLKINYYNSMMNFSVLTYNILFNKAHKEIDMIINKSHPDILCLQEISTDETNLRRIEKLGYRLADYSNSFIQFGKIYGVATYYDPATCDFLSSQSLPLSNSLIEIIFTVFQVLLGVNKPRTILKTIFLHKSSDKEIAIYNAHLIMVATNEIRLKHLKEALDSFINPQKIPTIIAGDFNYYPYGRKKLEHTMMEYNFAEATKNVGPTIQFSSDGKFENFNLIQKISAKIINKTIAQRMKTDYIFYRELQLLSSKKLNIHYSDHFPILGLFKI